MSFEYVSHFTLPLEKSNLQLKVSQSYQLTSSGKILLTSSEPSDPWWLSSKPSFRKLTYKHCLVYHGAFRKIRYSYRTVHFLKAFTVFPLIVV